MQKNKTLSAQRGQAPPRRRSAWAPTLRLLLALMLALGLAPAVPAFADAAPTPEAPIEQAVETPAAPEVAPAPEDAAAAAPLKAPAADPVVPQSDEETVTIYMTFEGFNLGQGYLIEPHQLEVPADWNVAQATVALLNELGIGYRYTGFVESQFYLSALNLPNRPTQVGGPGGVVFPDYILNSEGGDEVPYEDLIPTDSWLAEFHYYFMSGWMLTVNNYLINRGTSDWAVEEGAVVRWQYTVKGYGADLGHADSGGWGEDPYYSQANKDALIRALFAPDATEAAKQAALAVAINPLSTPLEVLQAIDALLAGPQAPEPVDITESLQAALAYLATSVPAPEFGTSDGEWSVLSLARGNASYVTQQYYDDYYNRIVETVQNTPGAPKLHNVKSTENSRLILALSSIGKDARNVGGYNLLEPYASFSWVKMQGINGTTFALIAFDTNGYEFPELVGTGTQTTRAVLINELLNKEIKKGTAEAGGWALAGSNPDPDMTGMVLQALARYYNDPSYPDVAPAVDRAVSKLAEIQNADGGYTTFGDANMESCVQVITALSGLGIDVQLDPRFQKPGGNPLTALLAHQLESGGFKHVMSGTVNGMATDQGTYGLVAYDRFLKGENSLYYMADAFSTTQPSADKAALDAAITAAQALIEADYTAASWAAFASALSAATIVSGDADATQEEVDDALVALTAAQDALIAAPAEPAASAKVWVQLDDAGYYLAGGALTAAPGLSEQYGYRDEFNGAHVSALDVLVAAHIALFGDEDLGDFLALTSTGFTSLAFGVASPSLVFYVNGAQPGNGVYTQDNSLGGTSQLGYSLSQARVANNDEVSFVMLQDSMWMDTITWFEADGSKSTTATVEAGATLELAIKGFMNWYGLSDAATQLQHTDGVEDAQLVVVTVDEQTGVGTFTNIAGALTNADGKAVVTFDTPGTYIVSAFDTAGIFPIVAPRITVTVTEAPVIPEADKTALNAAIAAAQELVEADYTATTWAAFALARTAAVVVSGDADATQAEVDDALAALTTAQAELVTVPVPGAPAELTIAGPATAFAGDAFDVKVSLANVERAATLYVSLELGAGVTYSEATLIASLEALAGFEVMNVFVRSDTGVIDVTISAWDPGVTLAAGTEVLRLSLVAADPGSASATLVGAELASYTDDEFKSKDVDVTLPSGDDATVTVTVEEPQPVYQRYDFNRDGKETLADLAFAQIYYHASEATGGTAWAMVVERGMDINEDGKLDIADYVLILGYLYNR
ncbi:MAG: FIVAR domain-containing protein [Coriobacteriales bacterium]|nr:FIVAR domain-containing protein [Coriobacteriales bacterium]